jgi:hypothetical protein
MKVKELKEFYEFIRERGRLYTDKIQEDDMIYDINLFITKYNQNHNK